MGLFSEKDIPPPSGITGMLIIVAFVLIVWMRWCGGSPEDIPLGGADGSPEDWRTEINETLDSYDAGGR